MVEWSTKTSLRLYRWIGRKRWTNHRRRWQCCRLIQGNHCRVLRLWTFPFPSCRMLQIRTHFWITGFIFFSRNFETINAKVCLLIKFCKKAISKYFEINNYADQDVLSFFFFLLFHNLILLIYQSKSRVDQLLIDLYQLNSIKSKSNFPNV